MKRGLARLWYRFKNWFRTKAGPGEPLRFLCGSEEELRRVTTWACHIHAPLFHGRETVSVTYTAKDNFGDVGRRLGLHLNDKQNLHRAMSLWFALIFRLNQFTGTEWTPEILLTSPSYLDRIFPPRSLTYGETPVEIIVRVHLPSAHERAEALLALSEWLDGKVSEEEKRELLQRPDDVEIQSQLKIRTL